MIQRGHISITTQDRVASACKGTIALLLCLIMAGTVAAQNKSNNPYSQYGLGMFDPMRGTAWANAMGGTTVTASGVTFVNTFNPASYSSIDKETLLFDMGFNVELTQLKDQNSRWREGQANISYINIGLPITKWWKTVVGMKPFSSTNYSSSKAVYSPLWDTMHTLYEGYGDINQFLWGNAFNITKGLSVGFNLNYLVGSLTRGITFSFDNADTSYFMNSRKQSELSINSLMLDLGVQYSVNLSPKTMLDLGLVVSLPRTFKATDEVQEYTFISDTTRAFIVPNDNDDGKYSRSFERPMTISLGGAVRYNEKWRFAFDGVYAPWHGMKEENQPTTIFGSNTVDYSDYLKVAASVGWLGDRNSSHYLKRVAWSLGMHYETGKLGLVLTGDRHYNLSEVGVSAGLSLPMRKGRSALHLALGYSHFGDRNLLQQDALVLSISLGTSESWFVKRKYN